jgi:hypothetical protein
MSNTPSIDYSCRHCGATTTYQLVPSATRDQDRKASAAARPIPSLDFSCSRCGASHTYTLMPVTARSNTA